MLDINTEYSKYRKGESKLDNDELTIVKAYEICLEGISTENIMYVTEEFEKILNKICPF